MAGEGRRSAAKPSPSNYFQTHPLGGAHRGYHLRDGRRIAPQNAQLRSAPPGEKRRRNANGKTQGDSNPDGHNATARPRLASPAQSESGKSILDFGRSHIITDRSLLRQKQPGRRERRRNQLSSSTLRREASRPVLHARRGARCSGSRRGRDCLLRCVVTSQVVLRSCRSYR